MKVEEKYLSAVRRMYELGGSFVPLNGKVPVEKEWAARGRETLEQALTWASQGNVGLRTGANSGGIIVVDVEVEAPPETVKKLKLPATVLVRTGRGGLHLYYRTDKHLKNSVKKLAPYVDLRGDGGQVAFVGSVHPDTGQTYEYTISPEQSEIAELPEEFIRRYAKHLLKDYQEKPAQPAPVPAPLNKLIAYVEAALREETARVRTAPEGTRNDTLNSAAFSLGTLVGAGVLPRDTAEAELVTAAILCGLSEAEAHHTVRSGLESGVKEPRQLPETAKYRADVERVKEQPPPPAEQLPPFFDVDSVLHLFIMESRRILYHRESYYLYNGRCYRPLTDNEVRAHLARFITGPESQRKTWGQPYTRKDSADGIPAINHPDYGPLVLKPVKPTPSFLNQCVELLRGYGIQDGSKSIPYWLTSGNRAAEHVVLQNGVMNLETYELQPHTDDLFTIICLPYAYSPKIMCPKWTRFLNEILMDDERMLMVLQELFGYCLTGSQDAQKIFIFSGEGNNGKSVCAAVLKKLIGEDNCSSVPVEALHTPHSTAGMVGKLVNLSSEWGHIAPEAEGILKAISGGDAIMVNPKNKPVYTAHLPTKIIVTTNEPPHISDKSHGMWRRIMVIPFPYEVPEERRIPFQSLVAELSTELPGIFNWALEGLKAFRIQGSGFTVTEEMKQANEEYRKASSPVWTWADEHIQVVPSGSTFREEAYSHYKHWSEDHGYRPVHSVNFGKEFGRWFRDKTGRKLVRSQARTGASMLRWCYQDVSLVAV